MESESVPENFSESEISKFFKIRKTVLKMLEDRGYVVLAEDKEKRYDEWKAEFKKDSLCFLTSKENNKSELIYVEFNFDPKIGVEQIERFAKKIEAQDVRNGIMIIKGTISALAKQVNINLIIFFRK
jgi:DNA-directed RNA polymerase I, II, and III subunit RPABC1